MLLAAGTVGGIFSTVVSIASLVSYPVLLALGVPPLSANMTNTVSLVLTGAGWQSVPGRNWRARASACSGSASSRRLAAPSERPCCC